ncbi:hypothetical protein MW887_011758 [Aspergillus wentii]|nr:hypothetical protein MW887_011758 [Aspergillus wentii]
MAAIYFDINAICVNQNNVKNDPESPDIVRYCFESNEAIKLVDEAVMQKVNEVGSSSEGEQLNHQQKYIDAFLKRLDWRTLAICAYSSGFRLARREDFEVWEELIEMIWINRTSLNLFARTRALEFRDLLLRNAKHLPAVRQASEPLRNLAVGNPHLFYQASTGFLKVPTYEGVAQVPVKSCIFDPKKWNGEEDPTIRTKDDGCCDLCFSKEICSCTITASAASLVELSEYQYKGVGVRALGNFKKGCILDEFIGELYPNGYDGDPEYSLLHESKSSPKKHCVISPKHLGNWTRFINHSCNPSTVFRKRTIGKRTMMTVETLRDISIFEEITIDYGYGYWRNRRCACRAPNCPDF